ncbi:MAG TPA: hypothetical protein VGF56_06200 [Rhizomicrobium sp.]|jgi:hypothetical protein
MRQIALALLALCFAASAQARDVRFPEKGFPAITYSIPDSWTATPDDSGNMILVAGDHTSAISISVVEGGQSLDDMATAAMQVAKASAPRRGEPISVSGIEGFTYYSTMTNDSGTSLTVKMMAVKPDANHFVTFSLLNPTDATPDQVAAGNTVMSSVRILTGGKSNKGHARY